MRSVGPEALLEADTTRACAGTATKPGSRVGSRTDEEKVIPLFSELHKRHSQDMNISTLHIKSTSPIHSCYFDLLRLEFRGLTRPAF